MSFTDIFGMDQYSIGVDPAGDAWGWGKNSYGQLLTPSTSSFDKRFAATPTESTNGAGGYSPTPSRLLDAAGDQLGAVGLDADGKAWAWGNHQMAGALLGVEMPEPETPYAPTRIVDEGGQQASFTQVRMGNDFAVGLDADGHVWAWGNNDSGQLGAGSAAEYSAVPLEIELPQPNRSTRIYWGDDDVEGSLPNSVDSEEIAHFAVPAHEAGRIPVYISIDEGMLKELIGYHTFMLDPTLTVDPGSLLVDEESTVTLTLPDEQIQYIGQSQLAWSIPDGLSIVQNPKATRNAGTLFDPEGRVEFQVTSEFAASYEIEVEAYVAYEEAPTYVPVSATLTGGVEFKDPNVPGPGPDPTPGPAPKPQPKPEPRPEPEEPAKTGASVGWLPLISLGLVVAGGGAFWGTSRSRSREK